MTCRWRALMQTVFSFSSFTPKALLLLRVGDVLRQSRTFSQQDVQDFSNVTHDRNPIHFDASAACSAGFNCGSVVHGMLVAGIFPCIIASHFPGAVYVSQSLHFKLPVYIGDEVVAEVQTLNLREMKNRYMSVPSKSHLLFVFKKVRVNGTAFTQRCNFFCFIFLSQGKIFNSVL